MKHLQAWPDDGLLYTLDNVLSFDKFDDELMQSLDEIFQSHDITIGPVRRWLAPDALTSRCSLGSLVGCCLQAEGKQGAGDVEAPPAEPIEAETATGTQLLSREGASTK